MDLRNHAPTALIVCCSDEDAAARMKTALSEEVVNKQTRGDGGSRKSGEDSEAMFHCAAFNELIVAGRSPIVKQVDITETMFTPQKDGCVLIAELGLNVMVQGQTSIRLPAFASAFASECIRVDKPWILTVAAFLERRSVRLMAGEFGNTLSPLLELMRKRMTINVCATGKGDGGPSAMLWAGPVGRVTILDTRGSGGPLKPAVAGGPQKPAVAVSTLLL